MTGIDNWPRRPPWTYCRILVGLSNGYILAISKMWCGESGENMRKLSDPPPGNNMAILHSERIITIITNENTTCYSYCQSQSESVNLLTLMEVPCLTG